jgi:hypothetical protein
VQQNASLVEEATAATESMKGQADSLLQTVARFRLHVGSSDMGRVASGSSANGDRRDAFGSHAGASRGSRVTALANADSSRQRIAHGGQA